MPTFKRCDETVATLARDLMAEFETHQPLIDARIKIDFVFAYSDKDDNGNPINDALTKNGIRALGICRKIALKDRALGRGDAEISLDGDWWEKASHGEQRGLLDHEMHHIAIVKGKTDDLGRPVIKLRKHDVEVGWFKCIAARHTFSQERIQAKAIMDVDGQYFWPELQTA